MLSAIPSGLQAEVDRIAADPASTRRTDVRRRPDAFATPGLEVARALIAPRVPRAPFPWLALALGAAAVVAIVQVTHD